MSAEPVKAYIVHHAPGRVRFRIPERRHDAAFFAEIETRLGKCANVRAVEVNPLTCGVLVRYSGMLETLLMQALASGLPALVEVELSPPPLPPLTERLREQAEKFDQAVKRCTAGETDARSLVLLGLLAAGVVQVLRGDFLGPAIPLMWYASQIAAAPSAPAMSGRRRAAAANQRVEESDQGGE